MLCTSVCVVGGNFCSKYDKDDKTDRLSKIFFSKAPDKAPGVLKNTTKSTTPTRHTSRGYNLTKEAKMNGNHLDPRALAERWRVSEDALERWRSEGIGPCFLKLCGQVRYRIEDIEAYEATRLYKDTTGNRGKQK